MELKFVDIDDYRKQVKHLFVTAFPREERPPMWMLTRRCRQGKARFRAVVDSGRFVGLTYVIGDDRVKTLMFLAIDESARDGGYGSAILKKVRTEMRRITTRGAGERRSTSAMACPVWITRSEKPVLHMR